MLRAAWQLARKNDGAPGIDGASLANIAARPDGVEGFLREIQEALRSKRYRPQDDDDRRRSPAAKPPLSK